MIHFGSLSSVQRLFGLAMVLVGLLMTQHSAAQTFTNQGYGGVTASIVKKEPHKTTYRLQSNAFAAHLFAKSDLDDYAYRVNRRNCTDSDVAQTFRSGHIFQYDFFGSDGVHVGSFISSARVCSAAKY